MMNFALTLKAEKNSVDAALKRTIADLPHSLRDVATHIFSAGGKRIRPILTINAARLFGAKGDDIYRLACIPEMIHAASLLHDDVLDNASMRRGKTTAHLLFGTTQAILAGDALLALANRMAASYGNPTLLDCVAEAVLKTAEGEADEMAVQHSLDHGMEKYLDIITGKTAFLLRGSCRLGAVYAGASEREADLLSQYGLFLGLAFQIVDDALDFAEEEKTGKPVGGDLTEGKLTPPLMFYMESLSEEERNIFRRRFLEGSFSDCDRLAVAAEIRRRGFDAKTRALAAAYLEDAERVLNELPQQGEVMNLFREMLVYMRRRAS